MWWCLIEKGSAHSSISWFRSRPLWLWNLTSHMLNDELQMNEAENTARNTLKDTYSTFTTFQQRLPQYISVLYWSPIWYIFPRRTELYNKAPLWKLSTHLCLRFYLTLLPASLLQNAALTRKPLLCPLQVFLGVDQCIRRYLFELVFQIPVLYVSSSGTQ